MTETHGVVPHHMVLASAASIQTVSVISLALVALGRGLRPLLLIDGLGLGKSLSAFRFEWQEPMGSIDTVFHASHLTFAFCQAVKQVTKNA